MTKKQLPVTGCKFKIQSKSKNKTNLVRHFDETMRLKQSPSVNLQLSICFIPSVKSRNDDCLSEWHSFGETII